MGASLFDLEARVAEIYPIHMLGDPENPPEWVEDIGGEFTTFDDPIFLDLPELKHLAEDDETVPYRWASALVMAGRRGFFAYYEICVREYFGQDMWSSGWGYYRKGYVYAATIDEVEPKVIAIAQNQHELEQANFLKKAGA